MRPHGLCRALRSIGGLTSVVLALAPLPPALARVADTVVDLRTAPSWLVNGGYEIGPVGDVNGDGVSDAVVSDCGTADRAGEVRVVWGPFAPDEVAFEDLEGFSIRGAQPGDVACKLSMQVVGDVNADGLDDVLVGAYRYYRSPTTVYVVFGKSDSETIHLSDFDEGTQGFQGYVVQKWSGSTNNFGVEGLGDMNEDGFADFIVGGGTNTYVVFGQSSTMPVNLRTFDLGTQANRGFLITNRCRECVFGFVGDVDGDGVPDVGVGGVGRMRYQAPGSAYVVFGKSDFLPVDTSKRSPQLFKIKGDWPSGMWDGAIAAAGDVNGDGLGDVIVGMPVAYSCCQGKVAVVFGKTDTGTVRLEDLGDGGFQVFAGQENDSFGTEAVGLGDIDDDGLGDIAVGADFHGHDDRGAGAVFVIYGSKRPQDLQTGRLGDAGYVIVGREWYDRTGRELGVPGDMNGDGVPDLMITAVSGDKGYLLWL